MVMLLDEKVYIEVMFRYSFYIKYNGGKNGI